MSDEIENIGGTFLATPQSLEDRIKILEDKIDNFLPIILDLIKDMVKDLTTLANNENADHLKDEPLVA